MYYRDYQDCIFYWVSGSNTWRVGNICIDPDDVIDYYPLDEWPWKHVFYTFITREL